MVDQISQQPARPFSLVEQEYKNMVTELDGKKVTGSNVAQVISEIRTLLRCSLHLQGKTDNEIERLMREEVKIGVKNVQGTYNSKKVLALTILSGSLSIAGGACGFGSFKPSNYSNALKASPDYLQGLSKGADAGKSIFENGQGSDRTGAQAELELSKDKSSKAREARSQADQQVQRMQQEITQGIQSNHQSILEMSRVR